MAKNDNAIDELNRLAQDNKIIHKDDGAEQKRQIVNASIDGNIDNVEQIIDVSTLEFYVHENDLFKNMREPCRFEGINILADIKEYFGSYKVKPKDLDTEIQKYMEQKRLGINQEHKTLFFGDNGVLDIDRTVEKALRNSEPIPFYVRNAAIDNGIKLPENIDTTLHAKFLSKINEQSDAYFSEVNKNVADRLEKINNLFGGMSHHQQNKGTVVKTSEGQEVDVSLNMPEEAAHAYVKIQLICGKLGEIFARGKSDNENQQLLARLVAYYNEILEISTLDFNQMGLSENDAQIIRLGIEETKKTIMYKFNMCSLGINIDELSEEELKNLVGEENYTNIVSKERENIDKNAADAVHEAMEKESLSLESDFISAKEEEKKINIIRQYRILMSLVNTDGPRYADNEDELIRQEMEKLKEKYPELVKAAEESYDSASTVEIYSKAIVRNRLLADLERIRTKGIDTSVRHNQRLRFQAEYSQITPAIIALNMDVRGVHEEDKAARDEALKTLIDVFPNVLNENEEINYEDERQIDGLKNRLFNEIRNRYSPHFAEGAFDSIKNYDELAKKLESRYIYKLKGRLINSINGNKIAYDEITAIIENPATKKYVREESHIENREIFENKLYINLTKDIVYYTKLKSQNKLTKELEDEFVVKLATAIQLLDVEGEDRYADLGIQKSAIINRNNSLLNEVKSNLADLRPDIFNRNGTVNINELNSMVVKIAKDNPDIEFLKGFNEYEQEKYEEHKGELSEELKDEFPNNGLTYLAEKTKSLLDEEIASENRSLSTKKRTQEEIKKNFKELVDTSKVEDAERVLQIVHYLKEERQERKAQRFFEQYKFKGAADFNTSGLKNAANAVEEEYKKRVKGLYNDDAKTEESLSKIENHIFDDTVFPGIIREGKRKIANRMLAPILKKYDRNDDELTIEEKATILKLYVGTEFDSQKEVIESSKNSASNLQARLKKYLARINPELVKNGEVDKTLLITEFNDYVNTNFVDIEDAVIHSEDMLIEGFVEGLTDKKNDKELVSLVNDDGLRANLKVVDAQTRRDNFHLIQHSLKSLSNSLLTRYDLEVTKQDEVELIKGLYLIVDLYEGQKLDRKGLSERNSNVQDLEKTLLEVAKENLKIYFNNTIDKDGKVDKQKLRRSVVEYLRENDPEIAEKIQDDIDIAEVLKESLREKDENTIGVRVNDSLEHEIKRTQFAVDEYNTYKEQFKYLAMINVLGKMRERFYGEGNGRVDRIALFFDKKCPGLKQKYDSSAYDMEVDDKYVDSIAIICGKSKLQEINEKYFPRGVKGKRFTKIEDIPLDEQKRILQTAIGTIEACKEMGDYKSVTKNYDAVTVASNIIKHFVPSAVRNGRIVDEEQLLNCYLDIALAGGRKSGNYTIDRLKKDSYKKLCLTVLDEFYSDAVDKTKYFEVFENSRLRSTIKGKRREDRISNQEMEPVFENKAEVLEVGTEIAAELNTTEEKGVVFEEPVIGEAEIKKVLQEKAVDLHHGDDVTVKDETIPVVEENIDDQTNAPKVEQQEDTLNRQTSRITVETLEVDSGIETKSMTVVEEKGFWANIIDKIKKIPEYVRNGINNLKDMFSFGHGAGSNNESASSNPNATSSGVTKTQQDVVRNLTGYGQQTLNLDAARAAAQTDNKAKVSDKGNELEVEDIDGK